MAMTDADSLPTPRWLERLAHKAPGAVAVYGPLRFYGVSPLEAAFSEWGYRAFLNLMALLGRPNLAGANMMVLKEAALKVGASPRWRRGKTSSWAGGSRPWAPCATRGTPSSSPPPAGSREGGGGSS